MAERDPDDLDLVMVARSGDPEAFGRLFDRWFDRTYDVAWRIVRNRDTAAEVAQESLATAWEQLGTLRQPESFGGWLLRIARNRALNRLDRERRSSPSEDDTVLAVLDQRAQHDDIAADVADQDRDQLIWAAAAALGERDTSLLDLHLRHDLGAGAIAEELGVTPNNAHQQLHRLRGRLGGAIRSWVLWRDGQERCAGLASALTIARVTHFGPEAVRVISRHAADCEVCSEAQRAVLAPEALFAAVPLVAAPAALKAKAAAGLAASGVPLGSTLAAATRASGPTASVDGSTGALDSGPHEVVTGGASGPTSLARRLLVGGAVVAAALAVGITAAVIWPNATDQGESPGGREEAGAAAERRSSDDRTSPSSSTSIPRSEAASPGASIPGSPPSSVGDESPGGGPPSGTVEGVEGPGGGEPGLQPGGGPTATGPGEPGGPGGSGTTTTTTAPPGPPVISGFSVSVQGSCGLLGLLRTSVLVWASTDGTSATLGLLDGVAASVPPSGSVTRCALLGQVYLLTVRGDGGVDQASLTIAL